jgi:hypothetical protein
MKDELSDSEFEHKGLDTGERKISKMNFSYIVTIPKRFVKNTRYERILSVRIFLLPDGCLKLVPSRAKNGDEEIDLES